MNRSKKNIKTGKSRGDWLTNDINNICDVMTSTLPLLRSDIFLGKCGILCVTEYVHVLKRVKWGATWKETNGYLKKKTRLRRSHFPSYQGWEHRPSPYSSIGQRHEWCWLCLYIKHPLFESLKRYLVLRNLLRDHARFKVQGTILQLGQVGVRWKVRRRFRLDVWEGTCKSGP